MDRWTHCFRSAFQNLQCKKVANPSFPDDEPAEPVETEPGYRQEYDRAFERGWHVIGLSADGTKTEERESRTRREVRVSSDAMPGAGSTRASRDIHVIGGITTVKGVQTE
ncbi:unnamed protein product [Choristocarpus tenellus]